MTPAHKRLRELRERQSKERQKMAELGLAETLSDEQRSELDTIEAGVPDLERQIRAATVSVQTEESEQREANDAGRTPEGDAEDRERAELRGRVHLSGYVAAAVEQRAAAGAEAEYNAACGISGNRFRSNCWPRLWSNARPQIPTRRPCRAAGWIACSRARRHSESA